MERTFSFKQGFNTMNAIADYLMSECKMSDKTATVCACDLMAIVFDKMDLKPDENHGDDMANALINSLSAIF